MLTRQARRELREKLAELWVPDPENEPLRKALAEHIAEVEALWAKIPPSPELTQFLANKAKLKELLREDDRLKRAILAQLGDYDA